MKRLKNFFKKNLKVIIIFIVSMIITSMVSVYAAYNYLSTDVSYTKADGTTVSVADALNELYKNKSSSGSSSTEKASLLSNFSGYYADVNDDGTVDGIIFIDMAYGAGGTGLRTAYAYSGGGGFKSYQVSSKTISYADTHFGANQVITPVSGSTGADRFYVMALSDYSTSTYTWANACKLTKTVGSVTFRLPSQTEWAAFADQFSIISSNYSSYGLKTDYWASTEYTSGSAWYADFSNYFFYTNDETNTSYARLCATF